MVRFIIIYFIKFNLWLKTAIRLKLVIRQLILLRGFHNFYSKLKKVMYIFSKVENNVIVKTLISWTSTKVLNFN
jgi:hypothetical protein